jgi:TonB family protein
MVHLAAARLTGRLLVLCVSCCGIAVADGSGKAQAVQQALRQAQSVPQPKAMAGAPVIQPVSPDASAPSPTAARPTYRFAIAAQPLATALEQYGEVTGRSVFFDSSMVAGLMSAPVTGVFPPEAALRMLLEGTGLAPADAAEGSGDAFVLKRLDTVPQPAQVLPRDSMASESAEFRNYDAMVQTLIWNALCNTPITRLGDYRTAVRFEIDTEGHLTNPRLLHSTGNRDLDLATLITLQQVQFDAPPPPDMAQPMYVLILPRDATPGRECHASS